MKRLSFSIHCSIIRYKNFKYYLYRVGCVIWVSFELMVRRSDPNSALYSGNNSGDKSPELVQLALKFALDFVEKEHKATITEIFTKSDNCPGQSGVNQGHRYSFDGISKCFMIAFHNGQIS